jgi:hypothetical protein
MVDSGPERAPLVNRRRVAAALTAAALLAGIVGLMDLREQRALEAEQRALQAEQRRLAGEVSLRLTNGGSGGGGFFDGSEAQLQAQLLVRNVGPRAVELVGARTSGFALSPGSVRLPAGEVRQLDLRQSFTCGQRRPAPLQPGPLQVEVRTGATTISTVELPLQEPPFGLDDAARVCGWVPVQEAVLVGPREGRQTDGVMRLQVDLSNVSRFPVEVVRLLTGPGLSGRLLQAGGAAEVPLPTTLPAAAGSGVSVRYVVELQVADCAAAREQAVTTGVEVRDHDGATADAVADYSPGLMAELLSASCP